MATRQIKDAKDLSTGNLIYFKGHAQATFMSDGRNVEDAINSVSDSIDTSNFPQYDNQQAITVQGINNGNGSTYAIPGSDIADGGEYVDTFALKSEIPDITGLTSNMQEAQIRIVSLQNAMPKKQDKFKVNGRDIVLDENIEVAELDLGANGRYAMADGLVDAEDNYYSLPSNPDNYGAANILATKADVNAKKDTRNLTYSLNNSTTGTVTLLPNVCIYMPNVLTGKLAINACATISSNNADLIESRICFRMPNNAALPVIQFNGVAIRWAGGNAPTFEADFTYEISLFYPSNANSVGPMGVCVGFK